ncbi:peptide-methionine (R)-S-oxide reductase MsrB [Flavobacterium sp. CS20]|uniref:peptide-methionine (R)-S-oxide reductase MsrB n=1 Tax=Flavobacterium sp. CS20 TaxID=2775246 RepID=UPI001B39E169|nr:peptide-methionine (R)-S-oxide reductase MsrB [Flavobacterium sp. CS20]QTY26555.1 peptide-methionine (R)-S-oxide reductase MsrB [Flavobacterium sp. CS20]
MKTFLSFILIFSLYSCQSSAQDEKSKKNNYEVTKTDAEWKAELSDIEYQVLREAGTERAFTSELLEVKQPGTFVCAACGNPLYKTKHKFDSGTSWPSFDRAIEGSVVLSSDKKIGYKRTELLCAKCGSHLGHMFNDGPSETTGKRHCINGVALNFVSKKIKKIKE